MAVILRCYDNYKFLAENVQGLHANACICYRESVKPGNTHIS